MTAKHMLHDLAGWRYPTPADMRLYFDRMKTHFYKDRISTWVNDGQLSPLEVYCYLKVRFGEPNGLMTLLRMPTTDNAVHWDYLLAYEDSFLSVMATQRRLEFLLYTESATAAEDWNVLIAQLKNELRDRKKEMSELRRGFERWITFVNPFRRLELIMMNLQDQLDKVDVTPVPPLMDFAATSSAVHEYCDKREELRRRTVQASTIGFSMRVLAPIMGEAFVNFLIVALAKDEIRNDSSLIESAMRTKIDVRVKSLSLTCNNFTRKINPSAQQVKDFFRLMNSRNELLHGSVDPKAFAVEEVFFDHRTIPLFQTDSSAVDRNLNASLRFIEPGKAREDFTVVNSFIAFVLTHIDEKYRAMINALLHSSFPGYRPDKHRLGLLFSETIVESFMGAEAGEFPSNALETGGDQ